MVKAILHIHCGNCGRYNDFNIKKVEHEQLNGKIEVIYLSCPDCATLHEIYNEFIEEGGDD